MTHINFLLKLIDLLSDGNVHSNEQIGKILDIDCLELIKKYIQIIQNWGINLFIIPSKGYILQIPLQLFNKSKILLQLSTTTTITIGRLFILSVIDSTNQYLIDRSSNLISGDACVAEYQNKGRGRHGKKWYSPFGSNIYFSIYWSFKNKKEIFGLNLMISIVIADMLQNLGAKGIKVKFPNDLYYKNRKLAGILVEIISHTKSYINVVIGVGINLTMHDSFINKINLNWINLNETGINIDRNILVAMLIKVLRQALWKFDN